MESKGLFARIVNSRTKDKIIIDNMDIWVRVVVRPLSFLVTYPLMRLKMTANLASFISIFISLVGLMMVVVGKKDGVLPAILVFNFWIVFDAVDGNIARTNGTSSKVGTFIDAISGYLYLVVLYIALGLAVYYISDSLEYWSVVVGFITSLMTVFPRLVLQKKNVMFGSDDDDVSSKTSYGWTKMVALNIAGPAGLMNPMMIVAFFTNLLPLYLIFYATIQGVLGMITVATVFKKVLNHAE